MLIGVSGLPILDDTLCFLIPNKGRQVIEVYGSELSNYNVINIKLSYRKVVLSGGRIENLPVIDGATIIRNEEYYTLLYRLENNGVIEGYRLIDSHGIFRDIRVKDLDQLRNAKFVNARIEDRHGVLYLIASGGIFSPLIKRSPSKVDEGELLAISDTMFKLYQMSGRKVCEGLLDNISNITSKATIRNSTDKSGCLVLPKGVTHISVEAFNRGIEDEILSIRFPNSVYAVYEKAFCTDKRYYDKIYLNNELKIVDNLAFASREFNAITIASFPTELRYIGVRAFYGVNFRSTNAPDDSLYINSNVIKQGAFMFSNLPANIVIGKDTRTIETGAFSSIANVKHIKRFSIEEGVQKILYSPDADIYGNKYDSTIDIGSATIFIPNSVTHIDKGAIKASIIYGLPNSEAERYAFSEGISFKSVFKVQKLGSDECEGLVVSLYRASVIRLSGAIQIPSEVEGVRVVGIANDAFRGCEITRADIPDGVKFIGNMAFSNCTKLVEVKLPKSLCDIGSSAFKGSGLISVDIPDGVIGIADEAFADCKDLLAVRLPSSLLYFTDNVFVGDSKLKRVTCRSNAYYSVQNRGIFVRSTANVSKVSNYSVIRR